MRVLVAGGGISGTVTAMALRRAGHEAVVFEAYPSGGADAGAFLTVMHNGMDALRAIEADGPVVDASFAALGVEIVGPDGTTVSTRDFDDVGLAARARSPAPRSTVCCKRKRAAAASP